jgi:hypothetical protein
MKHIQAQLFNYELNTITIKIIQEKKYSKVIITKLQIYVRYIKKSKAIPVTGRGGL